MAASPLANAALVPTFHGFPSTRGASILSPTHRSENVMKRTAALVVLTAACSAIAAADWPAWRGPSGQGLCQEKGVPLKWSSTENVKWKVPLAHPGNSTPVVWGDNIFLTQADKGGTERSLLCLARADGKVRWQKDVAYDEKEKNWPGITYANA